MGELFPLREQDLGRCITDLAARFEPADRFVAQVRQVMETKVPVEAEVRSFAGHWYLNGILPFRVGIGRTMGAGVAVTFTDITESKHAEDALRERDERISKLVALMPTGVCTCDADGVVTFFNERAIEMWGRTPDAGERFCGSYRMWTHDGAPVPHDQSPMARCIRDGQSLRDVEVVIEQPSGKRIVANLNVDVLFDRDGRPAGAINVFADVSDRKHVEQTLRRNETALTAELATLTLLHAFSAVANKAHRAEDVLGPALDTLLRLHGTDMGSIQLYERESLRIVEHRGFEPSFLDHLDAALPAAISARSAIAQRQRVSFEDVANHPDPEIREDAHRAGFRAVQSTPLVTGAGAPLGVISTQFRAPRALTPAESHAADILANELALALERITAEHELRASTSALRRNEAWLAAQNAAFRAAMDGEPLDASLGILIRAAIEQADNECRCAFYIADASNQAPRHVVGVPDAAPTPDCWSFPIETSTARPVGTFAMYFAEPREPTSRDRELAGMLTQTAGIIIARYRGD